MPTWGAHPPPPANPPMGRDRGNSMNGFQSLSHQTDLPSVNRQPTPTLRDTSPNVGRDMYGQLGSIHPNNQSPTAAAAEQMHRPPHQGLPPNPQAPSRLPPPPPNLPPAVHHPSSLQSNLQGVQGVELEQNPDGTINKNLVTTSIDASQLTSVVHALLRTMQSQSQCIETLEREFRMHVDQSRSQFEGLPKGVEQGRMEALESTVTALNGEVHMLNDAIHTNPLAESVDSTRTLLSQLQTEVQTQQMTSQQQLEQLRGSCNQRMEALETGMGSLSGTCEEVQKIPHMRQLLQEEITRKMKDAERRFGDQIQSLGSEMAKAEAFTRENTRTIEHAVNKKLSTVYERLQEKLKGRSCEAEQALASRLDELHKVVGEAEARAEAGVTRRFEELQNGFRVRMEETEGALAGRLEDVQRGLKERMESTEGHLRANLEDSTRAIEAVKAKVEGQAEGLSKLSEQSATLNEQIGGLADQVGALERAMVSDLATLQKSQEEGEAKARSDLTRSEEKIQQALPAVIRGMVEEALVMYSTQDFVQESLQHFASEVTRRFESAESMVQDFEQTQRQHNQEYISMMDGRMSPITQRVVQLEERVHGTESSFREREQRLKDNLIESMGDTDQRFSDLAEQTEQGLQQVALNAQNELEPLVHDVRSLHAQLTECIPRTEVDCLLRDMQSSLTTALTSALQTPPSLSHQPHIVAAQLASVVAPPRAPAPGPFIRQTPSRSGSPAPMPRHEAAPPTQPPAPQFSMPPPAPIPPLQPPSPPQPPAPSAQPTQGESPMTHTPGPSHAPSPRYVDPQPFSGPPSQAASASPASFFAGASASPVSTASSASPQAPIIPPTPAQGYDPAAESLEVREARLRQMGAMLGRR